MKRLLCLFIVLPLLGQQNLPPFPERPDEKRLPNGRLQSEAILKAEHKKNLEELDRMSALLDGVARELDTTTSRQNNAALVKDLAEVEKLAKRIRARMVKY